jgi:hypothetical protein
VIRLRPWSTRSARWPACELLRDLEARYGTRVGEHFAEADAVTGQWTRQEHEQDRRLGYTGGSQAGAV